MKSLWLAAVAMAAVACGPKEHSDTRSGEISQAMTDKSLPLPATLKETFLFHDERANVPFKRLVEFDVNSPLWSEGADKVRSVFLPQGERISFDAATGRFIYPVGTVFVKQFKEKDVRIETRVAALKSDQKWYFSTYYWTSDKTTEKSTRPKTVTSSLGTAFRLPSEKECQACHSDTRGTILGFRPGQLQNVKEGVDQIDRLVKEKILTKEAGEGARTIAAYNSAYDPTRPLTERVRTYLEVNCASCHNPKTKENFVNLTLESPDLGLVKRGVVIPGNPDGSKLMKILTANGADRMPPTSIRPDEKGVELLREWIKSL
jgi:hypothetical protein